MPNNDNDNDNEYTVWLTVGIDVTATDENQAQNVALDRATFLETSDLDVWWIESVSDQDA